MVKQAEKSGTSHLPSTAIRQFPFVFLKSVKSQLMNPSHWWKARIGIMALIDAHKFHAWMNVFKGRMRKRFRFKGKSGRVQRRSV